MSEKFTEDYVRTVHCAYPVSRVLDYISALEAEIEALKVYRDGFDPKVQMPDEDGTYLVEAQGDYSLDWLSPEPNPSFMHFRKCDFTRWWPLPKLPEVRGER